jgi:ubiquinol-cytochrome c reductase iron-sulfur subunit
MTHAIPVDTERRRWVAAASVAGGAGMVAASVPFVASLAPSERAHALGAPVGIDVVPIAPGELLTLEWRGKPVWVLRRTGDMLAALRGRDDLLADPRSTREQQPEYARNEFRSVKPELAVMVAICTHLGCVPTFRREPGAGDLGASWPGGFYCPCHGSKFDFAGRVFKNVPAPSNLEVPPHRYRADSTLLVGEDPRD